MALIIMLAFDLKEIGDSALGICLSNSNSVTQYDVLVLVHWTNYTANKS